MSRPETGTEHRGVDVAGPPDGQPIVFVHGVMFTRKMWVPQRESLAEEYRVAALDLPGHGERDREEFDFERALALVDEVVESVAGGRATVVGLSLGGYVATAYAHRHPEKVESLVIAGSSANPTGPLAPLTRAVSTASEVVTRSSLANRAIDWVVRKWVRRLDLSENEKREILESGFYPRQFGIAGFQLVGTDFRSAFASFPGPALVLNGQWDLLNRLGERKHADAAADARVEVVAGAGHVCNLEKPATFVDAVHRFVAAEGEH